MNFSHALSQSFTIAGYLAPHFSHHVIECGPGRIRVSTPLDRANVTLEFVPVFA